jgi:serine/threonine-protein kinase
VQVGEYVLEECMEADGEASLYRAVHPLIHKEVAVQVLRQRLADSPEELQRRLTEARAVNALHHRGILDLLGFGTLPDGQQYLMTELLHGRTLAQELELRGRLPAEEVLGLLEQVLAALEAAHGVGVAHRDLKLANIFLAEQAGGTRYVKLLGFGLKGMHSRPVPASANLQAVGRIAFHLLTGHPLAPGTELSPEVLRQCAVPPALEALILQLVDRPFESARTLRQRLATVRVPSPPPPAPSRPSARRSAVVGGLLVFSLLALGVGLPSCEQHARVSRVLDIQLP